MQLVQCLSLAMRSREHSHNNRHDISLSLLLLAKDLEGSLISLIDVWTMAESLHPAAQQTPRAAASPAPTHPPQTLLSGGAQLANALRNNATQAVHQIMHAFNDILDINYIDPASQYSLVSLALLMNYKDVSKILLMKGASALSASPTGRSAVYIACEKGYLDVLSIMLEADPPVLVDAPVTTEACQYNLLHLACQYAQIHIVKYLIARGANLDLPEATYGYTALQIALTTGSAAAAHELIAAGAGIYHRCKVGRTAVYCAIERGFISVVDAIVQRERERGTEVFTYPLSLEGELAIHLASKVSNGSLEYLLTCPQIDINVVDNFGFTSLSKALIRGDSAAALSLAEHGADVTRPSNSGRQPMYIAIEKGMTEVVVAFVKAGVNINAPMTEERVDGLPLSIAMIYKQYRVLTVLVNLGANVNAQEDVNGNTPIMAASCLGDYPSALFLLDHGADPTIPSSQGRLPLYAATEGGHTEIVRLLARHPRIHINAPVTHERDRYTALHLAVLNRHADTVQALLHLGSDVMAVDGHGMSAIERAAAAGLDSCIHQLFIQHQNEVTRRTSMNP
jgi:ankyrin repeat protein